MLFLYSKEQNTLSLPKRLNPFPKPLQFDLMNFGIIFCILVSQKKQATHLIPCLKLASEAYSVVNRTEPVKWTNGLKLFNLSEFRSFGFIRNNDHLAPLFFFGYIFFHNFTAICYLERTMSDRLKWDTAL